MSVLYPTSAEFFANEPNLYATFEFDKELTIKFRNDFQFYQSCCLCFCAFYPCSMCTYFMCDKPNNRDVVNAQHLAVTVDGIKYVVEKHPSGCRANMCDVGKISKTVPFDKITDCDIEEPGGAEWCGLVPRVLSTVNVDTASGRDLVLSGLADPHKFKELVWKMKRDGTAAGGAQTMPNSAPPQAMSMNRGSSDAEMVALLREQNELLKQQVQLLWEISNKK